MAINPVSQTFIQNALSLVTPNLTLADILSAQGFSTKIQNVHIHLDSHQKVDFSGCEFKGVTFSGNYKHATFDYVKFNDAKFHQADFSSTTFNHVSIANSEFLDTNINSASFIHSEVISSRAWNCDFSNAAFIDSKIHDSLIVGAGPVGLLLASHLATLFKSKGMDRKILMVENYQAHKLWKV